MRRFAIVIVTLTLGLLLSPVMAFARGIDHAADSIAGMGTTVHLANLAPGEHVDVTVLPPVGDIVIIPVIADDRGAAVVRVRGDDTRRAGAYGITLAGSGAVDDVRGMFTVYPDSVDLRSSRITTSATSIDANGKERVTITVAALDRYANPVPEHPFSLVSSRRSDRVDAVTGQTDDRGEQQFSLLSMEDGIVHLRAIDLLSGNSLDDVVEIMAGDGGIGGEQARQYAYLNDPSYNTPSLYRADLTTSTSVLIDHFEVLAPAQMRAGVEAQEVTIRAVDRNGRTVESYINTVRFSAPTDPTAVLPGLGSYRFEPRDQGRRTFALSLKFTRPGKHIFRVEDGSDARIFGQAVIDVTGTVIGASGSNGIEITSHRDGQTVNTNTILLEGKGPPFVNLLAMGGVDDVRGDTDREGAFSMRVTLASNQTDFTLRVRDDAGRSDSGPLHLILDNVPPVLGTVVFSPTVPQENASVQVTVPSEAKLASLSMQIILPKTGAKQDINLTETQNGSGSTYTAQFTAPENGNYQPKFTARDAAGNEATLVAQLSIGIASLPTVQKLRAEPRASAIDLVWDPVSIAVDKYRIYVGESEDNFSYTLETNKPTTQATLAGLTPGKEYFFAVTALSKDLESAEKSNVARAQAIGLVLRAEPGDAQVRLSWNALPSDMGITGYRIEMGLHIDAMQAIEDVLGTTATLTDLLNGVAYTFRVTPLASDRAALEDIAAVAESTPSGNGFSFSPNDLHRAAPLPEPVIDETPKPLPPPVSYVVRPSEKPVTITDSGLPTMFLLALSGIVGLAIAIHWRLRRSERTTLAFLEEMQSRYHR